MTVLLTSLGNLAVAIGMSLGPDRRAVVASYTLSLLLVLGLSLVLGIGADRVLASEGWLGWPVLVFGLVDLARMLRGRETGGEERHVSLASTMVLFCALSVDTLAVLTPFFAEEHSDLRLPAVLGGLTAIALTALALDVLALRLRPWLQDQRWLDFSGPVAMILAGLYILLDTPTDAI
ncbi:hypothetical protein [Marinibacterium sp. SX1]|uniref:hypothetical protein n=1 Tax=Marinibacterium sp. SX1 TaxID=3388424 RepID=UPI003D167B30